MQFSEVSGKETLKEKLTWIKVGLQDLTGSFSDRHSWLPRGSRVQQTLRWYFLCPSIVQSFRPSSSQLSSHVLCETSAHILSLQIKKVRHRGVRYISQDHVSSKIQSQDLHPGSQMPQSPPKTVLPYNPCVYVCVCVCVCFNCGVNLCVCVHMCLNCGVKRQANGEE